jgi:putative tributyrin esterase
MSRFRTVGTSDPRFDLPNVVTAVVKSDALGSRGDVTLFVPPDVESLKNLPVAILLHGVYSSHWAWTKKGGLHLTAARLIADREIPPMAIVMPSDGLWGDGSAYLPLEDMDVETWIVSDVPQIVAELIPSVSKTSPMAIGGLSMGGFGAMRLGAKYAERFVAISAHSAVTHVDHLEDFVAESLPDSSTVPDEHSLYDLLTANAEQLPPLRFDCGLEDPLIEHNRDLHRNLLNSGIEHEYEELSGGHDWDYWSANVDRTLKFFAEQFFQY